MKTIITTGFILVGILSSGFSQTNEYLIEHKTDRNANTVKFLYKSNSSILVHALAAPYDPDATGTPICGTNTVESIVNFSTSGLLKDDIDIVPGFTGFDFNYGYDDYFYGIGFQEGEITRSGMTEYCDKLVLGRVDSNGLADSVITNYITLIDSDCDFVKGGYMGMLFNSGYQYVLYRKTDADGRGIHLMKVKADFSTTTKIEVDEVFYSAQVKNDKSGFYIFCQNPNSEYEFRLAELDLDGDITYLSSYISTATDEYIPDFLYDGSAIYTSPRQHTEFFEVRKYKLNGDLLGTYDSGYMTQAMFSITGGLFLVQRPVDRYNDTKPIKLALIDYDFATVLGTEEYGHSNLIATDFRVDSDGTFSIVGNTENFDENSSSEDNDVIYFLHGKLTDLAPFYDPSGDPTNSKFYPNPNSDSSVFMKIDSELKNSEVTRIEFHDMNGRVVNPKYSKVNEGLYRIDVNLLSSGIYLGVAYNNQERLVSQLLVKR